MLLRLSREKTDCFGLALFSRLFVVFWVGLGVVVVEVAAAGFAGELLGVLYFLGVVRFLCSRISCSLRSLAMPASRAVSSLDSFHEGPV